MRIYVFLFLVLPLYNANTSFASELSDEVHLKNGEILSGEVLGQNEDGAVLLLGGDVIETHRVKKIVLRLNGDVNKDIVTHCDMVNDDGDLNIYLKDGRQHRGRIIEKYEERVKIFPKIKKGRGQHRGRIIEKYIEHLKLDTEYSGLVVVNFNDLLIGPKKEVKVSSKYRVTYFDVHMKDGKVLKRKRIKQNTAGDILIWKKSIGNGVRWTSFKITEIKKILPNAKSLKATNSFRWDVVHLKNGDRIRGHDLEVILDNPLKIQIAKESKELVAYGFDEVKQFFLNVDGSTVSKFRISKSLLWWLVLFMILGASHDSSDDSDGPEGFEGILKMFPVNY